MNELTHKNCLEGTLDQLGTAGPRITAALTASISKQHRDKRDILGGDQREALKGPDQVHELTKKSMIKSARRAKRSIALNPSERERDQLRPSGHSSEQERAELKSPWRVVEPR